MTDMYTYAAHEREKALEAEENAAKQALRAVEEAELLKFPGAREFGAWVKSQTIKGLVLDTDGSVVPNVPLETALALNNASSPPTPATELDWNRFWYLVDYFNLNDAGIEAFALSSGIEDDSLLRAALLLWRGNCTLAPDCFAGWLAVQTLPGLLTDAGGNRAKGLEQSLVNELNALARELRLRLYELSRGAISTQGSPMPRDDFNEFKYSWRKGVKTRADVESFLTCIFGYNYRALDPQLLNLADFIYSGGLTR